MGNLVETLRRNIDAVAIAAACLAVFLGSHSVCPRVSVPRIEIHALASDVLSDLHDSLDQIRLPSFL
jgi:hypothetical protein